MWLWSTFISYPTTFLTFQRTISSCLLATIEVVDRPKSYLVDVLCLDYPSHQTVTYGYKKLFSLIPLLSLLLRELYHIVFMPQRNSGRTQILSGGCIVRRLPDSSNSYMWLRRTISSCLLATVEVVDRPKSYKVDVWCVHYSSHQTLTCGYEVVFSLNPLLSLLFRELYLLVSLQQ
jgi:hypothetical protein